METPLASNAVQEFAESAGDDAVVIFRESLRFHERFAAAVRATSEIGTSSSLRVAELR